MSDKTKRFKIGKGLYAVDTRSGHGDKPSGISAVADKIHKDVEENFDPTAVRGVDMTKREEVFYIYKIKNKKTGLFSKGGCKPTFSKHGKIWKTKGYLKSHLSLVKSYDECLWVYRDCKIVEYECTPQGSQVVLNSYELG